MQTPTTNALIPYDGGSMEFDPYSEASGSAGLDPLLHVKEQQLYQHAKRLQTLANQAHVTANKNAEHEERARRRAAHMDQLAMEREAEAARRAEAAAEVEERRLARLRAAEEVQEQMRRAAEAKVQAVEERLERLKFDKALEADQAAHHAKQVAQRREAKYRQSLAQLEERRSMLLEREAHVEKSQKAREEVRQLQAAIKAEEEFLREQQRVEAKARAEAAEESRRQWAMGKNSEKDRQTARRQQELEMVRHLKALEARQRSEYLELAAREAAEADAHMRETLRARIDDKMSRADKIAAQRNQLVEDMRRIRQQMQAQEESLRAGLERMQRQGSSALPAEVYRSLELLTSPRSPLYRASLSSPKLAARMSLALPSPSGASPLAGASPRTPRLTLGYTPGSATPAAGGSSRPVSARERGSSGRVGVGRSSLVTPRGSAFNVGTPRAYSAKVKRPVSASAVHRSSSRTQQQQGGGGSARRSGAARHYTTYGATPEPASRREGELRRVLQEEIRKEAERQDMLAGVGDEAERVRLSKVFAVERESARQRILALSSTVNLVTPTQR